MKCEVVIVDVLSWRDICTGNTDFFAVAANRLTRLDGTEGNFVTRGNGIENCHYGGTCLNMLPGRQKDSSNGYVVVGMQ
jgi:hypothetical protein